MPIIRSSRVLYKWLLPVVFGALVFKLSVWCAAESYVSGLRAAAGKFSFFIVMGFDLLLLLLLLLCHISLFIFLLFANFPCSLLYSMMGIMVPETC